MRIENDVLVAMERVWRSACAPVGPTEMSDVDRAATQATRNAHHVVVEEQQCPFRSASESALICDRVVV